MKTFRISRRTRSWTYQLLAGWSSRNGKL